ncbi:dihydroflavonol-4-reductase [Oxalobacteraceae bacterium GrIS 2.11]
MTTVFVTGASGFLGGHILSELVKAGHTVKALSRRSDSDAAIAILGGTPVRSSLNDVESLKIALADCSAVFHAAADTSMWKPHASIQSATNVLGTHNLLKAARSQGVEAFIHTSSVSAFSHLVTETLVESLAQRGGESWINYERSKYMSEQLVRDSALPWIVFNPANIIGPGDRHNWARMIMLIDQERLPGVPPGTGSFADVREVARAQIRAWQDQRFGQCYLTGGEAVKFIDFVHKVGAQLGKKTPKRSMPVWAIMSYARLCDAWSRISGKEPEVTPESATLTSYGRLVDSSKAVRELDYRITPIDTLIEDTLAWMRLERLVEKRLS